MENNQFYKYNTITGFIIMTALCFLIPVMTVHADVSFHVSGRVYSIQVVETDDVIEYESDPVPIPAALIEIWNADTMILLGSGGASLSGYYHVMYTFPDEPHPVIVRVLQIVDGVPMLMGEVTQMPDESPIIIDDRDYTLILNVRTPNSIRYADSIQVSPSNQFMFVEVGNIDMDEIYDKEQDGFPYANRWGLTKDNDSAFGGDLELYGLFGLPTSLATIPYYYRISYKSTEGDSGYITDPLWKKNYVIVGTDILINRINMYKESVTTWMGPLDHVYVCDEGLIQRDGYSHYWTEIGQRALWKTGTKVGNYTLTVEVWSKEGIPITPSGPVNNYATLNLHLVNNPPDCIIHTIEYLDGSIILGPGDECSSIILLRNDGYADNDNIQFNLTAWQDEGFIGRYQLKVFHGHDTVDGNVFDISYTTTFPPSAPPELFGVNPDTFISPPSIIYQDCAYRFRLHIWPRITNGIDRHIYEQQDNWYAHIDVVE
jgi:hypothetical protein